MSSHSRAVLNVLTVLFLTSLCVAAGSGGIIGYSIAISQYGAMNCADFSGASGARPFVQTASAQPPQTLPPALSSVAGNTTAAPLCILGCVGFAVAFVVALTFTGALRGRFDMLERRALQVPEVVPPVDVNGDPGVARRRGGRRQHRREAAPVVVPDELVPVGAPVELDSRAGDSAATAFQHLAPDGGRWGSSEDDGDVWSDDQATQRQRSHFAVRSGGPVARLNLSTAAGTTTTTAGATTLRTLAGHRATNGPARGSGASNHRVLSPQSRRRQRHTAAAAAAAILSGGSASSTLTPPPTARHVSLLSNGVVLTAAAGVRPSPVAGAADRHVAT
jgi:hypothetical protein